MALLLCAASIADLMVSCDSYERKMERLNKVASEFKATLSPNNQILAERIDSTAQKVFYLEPNEDGDGIKNINVHDYVTNETHSILPEGGSIEDFEFCDTGYGYVEYVESRLIKDRLFFKIWSGCMWRLGATGVFFVNIRDNSLHYIESCDDATFLENGEIEISKYYVLGENEYGGEETERKQYTLSTSLSDEAYADNRQEQKRIEERLAEEWRNRPIERRIYVSFNVDSHGNPINIRTEGCEGIYHYSNAVRLGGCNNTTTSITVPKGKKWIYNKRFSKGIDQFALLRMDKSAGYYAESFTRDGTYIIRGGQTIRICFNQSLHEEKCFIDVYFTEKNE